MKLLATLIVPEPLPSNNVWQRMNPFAQQRMIKGTKTRIGGWYVKLLEAGAGQVPKAWRSVKATGYQEGMMQSPCKRRVEIIVETCHEWDPLAPQTPADKLILDNLVRLGVLVDDSAKWCEVDVKSVCVRRRTGRKTTVRIWET